MPTLPFLQKNLMGFWAVPGYAHAPFSPNFLMGFCSDGPTHPANVPVKFEVRSITHLPVPEITGGTLKRWTAGQPLDTPTLPFL